MDDHSNEYLAHYGVLGMKWGVRKNPQRAYTKATKKYNKLKTSSDKKATKAKRAVANTPSRLHNITGIGKKYYNFRMHGINSKNAKAARAQIKAEKWLKSMRKEFSKVPVESLGDVDISWLYRD